MGWAKAVPVNLDLIAEFQREQLHRAAGAGNLARVCELLAAGFPVNRFDALGKTPLHHAVAGEHFGVVDALLRAGANVNAQSVIGDTPLGECAASCSLEMAKRLIDAGADPTIPGWMMLTAIDGARDRKRADGRKVLALLKAAAASGVRTKR